MTGGEAAKTSAECAKISIKQGIMLSASFRLSSKNLFDSIISQNLSLLLWMIIKRNIVHKKVITCWVEEALMSPSILCHSEVLARTSLKPPEFFLRQKETFTIA